MARGVMPAFRKYHGEAVIIGRLLAGYGELEVGLCNCVAMSGAGTDKAVKAMFRPRGEKKRIDTAESLAIPAYQKLDLATEFAEAVLAMRQCLVIRNQYAHCQWYDDYGPRLAFVNMEEIAHQNAPVHNFLGLTTRYVDVPLLTKQEAFFAQVDEAFSYVNFEGRKRAGTLPGGHIFAMPPFVSTPPFYL
jgi:hypothetical protein